MWYLTLKPNIYIYITIQWQLCLPVPSSAFSTYGFASVFGPQSRVQVGFSLSCMVHTLHRNCRSFTLERPTEHTSGRCHTIQGEVSAGRSWRLQEILTIFGLPKKLIASCALQFTVLISDFPSNVFILNAMHFNIIELINGYIQLWFEVTLLLEVNFYTMNFCSPKIEYF